MFRVHVLINHSYNEYTSQLPVLAVAILHAYFETTFSPTTKKYSLL